jgi:protein-disulfide isomerase
VIIRLALLASLCLLPLSAKAETLSPEQKTEVEALIKKVLEENPQLIIDSVEKHRVAQMEKDMEAQKAGVIEFQKTLGDKYGAYTVGNPKADVTIVEFFDYNCGYCKKAFEEVNKLIEEDKNVKVVFFEMPILGPQSTEAAKWSAAAAAQGKYFDFHRALMSFQGPKTDENLAKLAKDAGLDVDKAKAAKDSPDIMKGIEANIQKAQELGFSGTPGFIIGSRPVFGYMEYDAMKSAIETERQDAKKNKKTDG